MASNWKHVRLSLCRYCVEFEVLKASKACHKLPPYNKLAEGEFFDPSRQMMYSSDVYHMIALFGFCSPQATEL